MLMHFIFYYAVFGLSLVQVRTSQICVRYSLFYKPIGCHSISNLPALLVRVWLKTWVPFT